MSPSRLRAVDIALVSAGGVLGALARLGVDSAWALLGIGFCGAFTTFSSFAAQSVDQPVRRSGPYVLATVVLALGACVLGWQLGSWL